MASINSVEQELRRAPRRWLVTGVAGFIGSHLLETLLLLDQHVVGVDNFATGHRHNIEDVLRSVGYERAGRFTFIEGDICDREVCRRSCDGVDYVLHQAALGSVPRSIKDPIATNLSNVSGFLNMLVAARDAGVRRFVYAASSSTYGDDTTLPKQEHRIGRPLSPYAVSKYVNELYAGVFRRTYGLECVGLRYFNVFGPRQDPNGAYAAVIPLWINRLLGGDACDIFGDGQTSRDFSYVANVVQANLLAATSPLESDVDQVYNVGCGGQTTLRELHELIRLEASRFCPDSAALEPRYANFRAGDVRHSLADTSKIEGAFGYKFTHDVRGGIAATVAWYAARHETPSPWSQSQSLHDDRSLARR
ncbi:MAG TPA: SDR family oxidoreductase [Gemmatimonadaceae bacterium]|jgi:UDP-N-acetylglucosamine 4-epimerase